MQFLMVFDIPDSGVPFARQLSKYVEVVKSIEIKPTIQIGLYYRTVGIWHLLE